MFRFRPRTPARTALGALAIVLLAGAPHGEAAETRDAALAGLVQKAFPNTPIGSIRCGVAAGLCEVTAGRNVFYVSPDGRFALVGSLLDLKDRIDLTDRRQGELAALDATLGKVGGGSAAPAPNAIARADAEQTGAKPAPNAPRAGPPSLGVIKVDLPIGNAVIHHKGAAVKLAVISDYNCGFCRRLFDELKSAADIEVTEYPIQLLRPDSADKAKLALCGSDRETASNSIYFGGEVKASGDCSAAAKAVEENTAFARAHQITGTPTLIRADGQAVAGYMPLEQLRAWAKGAQRS